MSMHNESPQMRVELKASRYVYVSECICLAKVHDLRLRYLFVKYFGFCVCCFLLGTTTFLKCVPCRFHFFMFYLLIHIVKCLHFYTFFTTKYKSTTKTKSITEVTLHFRNVHTSVSRRSRGNQISGERKQCRQP